MNTFSKKEAIQYGWDKMKEHFWFFAGISAIAILIGFTSAVYNISAKAFNIDSIATMFTVSVVSKILGIIVTLGLIKIALNIARDVDVKYKDLFSQSHLFFKYLWTIILLVSLLVGLIFVVAVLFIVSFVIFTVNFALLPYILIPVEFIFLVFLFLPRIIFWQYFIVDKNIWGMEAIKKSLEITKGNFWNLFLFLLLIVLINIAGAFALIVGLFVTIPITQMALVFVYRKLSSEARVLEDKIIENTSVDSVENFAYRSDK